MPYSYSFTKLSNGKIRSATTNPGYKTHSSGCEECDYRLNPNFVIKTRLWRDVIVNPEDSITFTAADGTVTSIAAGATPTQVETAWGNSTVFLKANGTDGPGSAIDASTITEGTLDDARLSSNVPIKVGGKIASGDLPAYVDDVLEFANFAALPATGTAGIIYVTVDTNFEYRWSGSTYIQLVSSPGTTDALTEGTTSKYFTNARAIAATLTGYSKSGTNRALAATDSIIAAFGLLEKKADDNTASVTGLSSVYLPLSGGVIVAPSGSSNVEFPLKITVSDDATNFFTVYNNTSGNGVFEPGFVGYTSRVGESFNIMGGVASAADSGTAPAVVIQGRKVSNASTLAGAALTTKPIFGVYNYSTRLFSIDASGQINIGSVAGTYFDGASNGSSLAVSQGITASYIASSAWMNAGTYVQTPLLKNGNSSINMNGISIGFSASTGSATNQYTFIGGMQNASNSGNIVCIGGYTNLGGTATGGSALLISPQSTGNNQYLINAGTNTSQSLAGTHTQLFTVDYSGNVSVSGVIQGPNVANGVLRIKATPHATTTSAITTINENGGFFGIGNPSPLYPLDVLHNSGSVTAYFRNSNTTLQTTFYLDNDRGSFASYGGFLVGSTLAAASNLFGQSRRDRLFMFADGASNLGMYVGTLQAQPFAIGTNNTTRWTVDASGHFLAGTDNTYDIGASGASRVRNLYVAGTGAFGGTVSVNSLLAGSSGLILWSGKSIMASPSDGIIKISNQAESDFGRLQLGGTTSSFPSLKRTGAGIDIRLADDSGYAALTTLREIIATSTTPAPASGFVSIWFDGTNLQATKNVGGTTTTQILF